jgi:hypothetical protein
MIAKFVPLLLVLFVASCSWSASAERSSGGGRGNGTQTTQFRSGDELRAYRKILVRMDRLKKASVKTIQASFSILPATVFCGGLCLAISACICVRVAILLILWLPFACMQSPDGDVIHCVPAHQQPAFDHPKMRGQKPEVCP